MAKKYKKLQKKLFAKPAPPKGDYVQDKVKGKDYFLLGIIIFTMMITLLGWQELDMVSRIMYVLMTVSLTLTYIRRQNKFLSDNMKLVLERTSLMAIGLSLLTFIYVIYNRIAE